MNLALLLDPLGRTCLAFVSQNLRPFRTPISLDIPLSQVQNPPINSGHSDKNMSAAWRENPKLRERFHPEYPDCIQVMGHRGGPRISDHTPGLVWIRVSSCEKDVFSGIRLESPSQLPEAPGGGEILFIVPAYPEYPL